MGEFVTKEKVQKARSVLDRINHLDSLVRCLSVSNDDHCDIIFKRESLRSAYDTIHLKEFVSASEFKSIIDMFLYNITKEKEKLEKEFEEL